MFCEKCGAKNDSSSKFCEKCGNKLEDDAKATKENDIKVEEAKKDPIKINKKTKVIGILFVVIIVTLFGLYKVGEKKTSMEAIATNAFEELASKKKISDKYLSVSLNSDGYFVSLEDTMKKVLEDEDIALKYSDYDVKVGKKKVTIKYKDKEDKKKYKVVFEFTTDGKSMLFYDKYIIKKIYIKNDDSYKETVIYAPDAVEKLTLTTIKDSTIKIEGERLSDSYIDSKKSDDNKDVYVVKGVQNGSYNVEFTVGGFTFEYDISVVSKSNNEYDLTKYISSYYAKKDDDAEKEIADKFKTYLEAYYEAVSSEDQTVDDFSKKYKVTSDIKDSFSRSKENSYYTSFKIDEVAVRSFSYDSYDEEFTINYRIDYTYTTEDNESEKSTYEYTSATYNLNDLDLPISLSYLPY